MVLFTDGTSALEQLSAHAAPDVLLLDWLMPSLTGLDVCRFIRSAEASWSGLPIVLLTVSSTGAHRRRAGRGRERLPVEALFARGAAGSRGRPDTRAEASRTS